MLRILRSGNKRTKAIWWAVALITIVTFVGGFIFLFAARLDPGTRTHTGNTVGRVNGDPISASDYQTALNEQRENYHRQFNVDPAERDEKMLEVQAWRSLVAQRLMAAEARKLGLKPHDHEVLVALQTSPPSQVTRLPAFQTNGKFDAAKYQAAMRDPNQNWSSVEDLVRSQLPVRKLQERLMASIKLTEPELEQAFRDRYDRVNATVLQISPAADLKPPPPSDADLARVYQQFRGLFSSGLRVQLEVLSVPKKYGDEEVRTTRELAASLARRIRAGEDFAQIAKDYSEGPGAANGGEIPRILQLTDFGPELAARMSALKVGEITDPLQEQGRFMMFRLLDRPVVPGAAATGFKVAQIILRVRPNETTLRDQSADMLKLCERAVSSGLGRAAAEKGLATSKTAFYDYNNPPQQLYSTPEASDWGLGAKLNQVSGVFEGLDEFVIVQVASRHEGGPASRDEIGDPLRQLAVMDARVTADRGRADLIAADLSKGATLEAAAKTRGLVPLSLTGLNRVSPDPRLFSTPEIVGRLFALEPGRVVGPVRAVNGWYFLRVDQKLAGNPALFDTLKSQISSEILQRRQQTFFAGFLLELRARARVEDQRAPVAQ
ncbi:MAG: SurA N-terminal domain-containing protein [Candidatus Eisenbacteria bacterium]|nr:SurA N-terminal domain-containing protein [Candidatus Eisenbacteria bacterium]